MSTETTPRIDIHAHVLVEEAHALVAPHASFDKEPALHFSSADTRKVGARALAAVHCQLTTPSERLPDMDRMGVDMQVLSPSPTQYYYWTEPEFGLQLARMINDQLAAIVKTAPERFAALGSVPLQDAALAVGELGRCMDELGFAGIEIGSQVDGVDFDDPRFEPFFAESEAREALLFLHPLGFTHGERMREYYLNNIVGNPLESTLALSHLIFGGVLERHPGLRLCVAHGGGYLPMYVGRMDHAYAAREDSRRKISRLPSSFLSQLYFDTVVHDALQLEYLVKRFGSEHLLLGTDYPFDMGEADPLGLLDRVPTLSAHDKRAIAGGNALRLLERARRARK